MKRNRYLKLAGLLSEGRDGIKARGGQKERLLITLAQWPRVERGKRRIEP